MDAVFKERVRAFAASQGLTVKGLQDELGLSNAHFSNTSKVTPKVGAKMRERYPDVNIDWLNYGRGEMLLGKRKDVSMQSITVPMLPIVAMAGALTDFEAQVNSYDCERIISPIKDAQLAITISGDSMSPEYPSGSIVFVQKINERSFIEWGKTFVLDTHNGPVIKKIFPSPNDTNKVICRSVNPSYSDFEVPMSDINGWYVVRLQMTRK